MYREEIDKEDYTGIYKWCEQVDDVDSMFKPKLKQHDQ